MTSTLNRLRRYAGLGPTVHYCPLCKEEIDIVEKWYAWSYFEDGRIYCNHCIETMENAGDFAELVLVAERVDDCDTDQGR